MSFPKTYLYVAKMILRVTQMKTYRGTGNIEGSNFKHRYHHLSFNPAWTDENQNEL